MRKTSSVTFILLLLFSTGTESTIIEDILDRARQRALSGTLSKRSSCCTADHDDLVRDVVTRYSENERLSDLYEVFQTLLTHLGMDAMSEGSFYDRAGTLRRQLRLTPIGPSIPSSESSDFCDVENDPKCSDEDFLRRDTRKSPENQDAMLTSSSEDLAISPEHDCNLLNDRLNNEGIYGMLLGRARQRMETQPTSSKGFKKYTLAHDQLIMDVVECLKSAGSYRKYEIFNRLTADLGMVKMEWTTFLTRACLAKKQTCNSEKQNTRRPKIGFEASHILGSILDENPRISGDAALLALESKLRALHNGDFHVPSTEEVRKWLQYTRKTRRFADIQQLNLGGSNAQGVDKRKLCGYPQKRSARVPAIGLANSRLLDSLFQQDPKISQGAAMKALKSVPRDSNDESPLASIAQVRSWLAYRRNVRRFVAKNALGSPDQDDADLWREISLALADEVEDEALPVSSISAISRMEEDKGGDFDDFREFDFSLPEREEDDYMVPSSSALSPAENAEDTAEIWNDIWNDISVFLTDLRNEDNINPGSSPALENEGPCSSSSTHPECGKRKRDD